MWLTLHCSNHSKGIPSQSWKISWARLLSPIEEGYEPCDYRCADR
jgi:hypothetical protein